MDQNMIAPVRGRVKKKRDWVRIGLTVFIIVFVISTSVYLSYWYFIQYPNVQEEARNQSLVINQSIFNSGRLYGEQVSYEFIEDLRINCEPLKINYTNENNQSMILTYVPVEGCMSNDQIMCLQQNVPQ